MGTYVMKDGRQEGPFEDPEILGRIHEGIFLRTDLAWREGFQDWKPLGELYPDQAHKLHLKQMPPSAPHVTPEDPKEPNSHLQRFITGQMEDGRHMPAVIKKLVGMGVEEKLARTLVLKVFSEHGKN